MKTAEEVCVEYAIAMKVARASRWVLRNVKCEYEEKPERASTDGYPGCDGVPPCTSPQSDNAGGVCEACEKQRMPALDALKEARRRIAKARNKVERVGIRLNAMEGK